MKILKIAAFLVLIAGIIAFFWFNFGIFQLRNPAYLLWILSDKPCPPDYLEKYVFPDDHKRMLVSGRDEAQIRQRFPMIFSADDMPPDSERAGILAIRRDAFQGQEVKMFWFDNQPDSAWGWTILLVNGKGLYFEFCKP